MPIASLVSRSSKMHLPQRIKVQALLQSRYSVEQCNDFSGLNRPANWDNRVSGQDQILTTEGHEILLRSNGAQSTPKVGWVLLLTSGNPAEGYDWTLYGIPKVVQNQS